MTLRHMKIFVTVCQTGSMTAAAKQLYMSQPAVSLAIAELEQNYGVKLFDRISQRLHMTEAGSRMLNYAEHITQLFGEMERVLRDGDAVGTLRIGTSLNIGGYYLPYKVAQLKKQYPSLDIRVIASNTESITEAVLKNELDVAVVEGASDDPYLVCQPVLTGQIVFVCSPDHPFAGRDDVELADVVKEPVMLLEKGTALREQFDSLVNAAGLSCEPIWECASSFPIMSAVGMGLGVSFLPLLHTSSWINNGQITTFRVKGLDPTNRITAVYHRNKYLTQSARDFIALWSEEDSLYDSAPYYKR